eukprot:PITA_06149
MNKGETIQSYVIGISCLRDQLHRVGENVSDRELVVVTLRGLPPIWETFITKISNNNFLPTFDEIIGKLMQEESRMIARGRIQKHEEGEPAAYITHDKKKKTKGENNKKHHYNTRSNYNDKRTKDYQRKNYDRRFKRDSLSDHEEHHPSQKKLKSPRYESNAINKSEYILISSLTSSSPLDSWDSWLVDSGATHHFSGYKEVLSNLVERETKLNIILGDNSTHPMKGFVSFKF